MKHRAVRSRPRTIDEVDLDLEDAIEAFRRAYKLVAHGQVGVRVVKHQGTAVGHSVSVDPMTPDDVLAVMTMKPRKEGGH